MAEDTHGMGIPLPADSTPIWQYPRIAREMGEKIAEILAGKIPQALAGVIDKLAKTAVDVVLDEAPIPLFTDPGIPNPGSVDGYDEVVTNNVGRLARGLKTDGTNHLPHILAQRLDMGETITETGVDLGYKNIDADGAGRMSESAYLANGTKPQWVLDRWASRMPGAGASSLPISLLIVAGQSNATRVGASNEPVIPQPADDRVLFWSHGSGAITAEASTQWLGSGFARQWVKDNPSRRCLIVQASVGSTGFWSTSITPPPAGYNSGSGTWDRTLTADPNCYPITLLRDRVADAAAAAKALTGEEPPKIAMLWCQGENDTGHAAQYQAKMDDLFSYARTLWKTPKLPILVASMTPATIRRTNGGTALDLAQQDTPRRLQLTAYQRGPEGAEENTANRTHYLPVAQELRGAELAARVLQRALRNAPAALPAAATVPPQNARMTRSAGTARISWEHPPCQLTAIRLQTSTDAGATWTEQPLPVPAPIEAEVAAPAAGPLWARLITVNGENTSYPMELKQ